MKYVHSNILDILVNTLVLKLRILVKKLFDFLMISQRGCKKELLARNEVLKSKKCFPNLIKSYSLSKQKIIGSRRREFCIKKYSGIKT